MVSTLTVQLSKGTETKIPSGPLAGTYITADGYTAAGQLDKYEDSAAAGLPAETVDIGYDPGGDPVDIGSSAASYVSDLSYTELGQPLEYQFQSGSDLADLSDYYNYQGQLTQATATTDGSAGAVVVDDQNYSYDNAGNITADADTPSGGPAQVQCYTYDYLGRLAQSWSQGSAGCTAGPSQSAEATAAAPYWQSYTYNRQNDLTSQTSTPASGAATTITNTFPATTGAGGPHAIASQQTTGPAGTSTTSYGYDAAGQTTSITTPTQTDTLAWTPAGQLSSVTTGSTAIASYIYDASGSLLLQTDPTTQTLYLPDEQLTATTTGTTTTLSGTRYYTLGGATVAARTSSGDVQYLIGNQQNTATVAIDAATLNVTRRYYDPYGNPLSPLPASWPGNQGFVGGTPDPATGLTSLGARQYNPATATFISPDPLLDPTDPQDLNAYAYATDNPATNSDPTGQYAQGPGGGGVSCNPGNSWQQACGGSGHNPNPGNGNTPTRGATPSSSQDTSNDSGGAAALLPSAARPAFRSFLPTFRADYPGLTGPQAELMELKTFCDQTQTTMNACGRSLSIKLLNFTETLASMAVGLFGLPGFGGGGDEGDEPGTPSLEANIEQTSQTDLNQLTAAEDGSDLADAAAAACGESFTAGTKVLLASGAAIAISQLKPGDKVLATNVKTGKAQAEPVTAVLVHHDTDRYDLRVKTARGSAVIDTTRNHLFWDVTRGSWVQAGALKHGDHLRTTSDAAVTVIGGQAPADTVGWMWDLSVPGGGDHDFYIDAASAAILVHNCPVEPEDVHGLVQAGSRGIDEAHVWANYDQQFIQESNGAIVRVLDNGNGTSDVVIRYGENPTGTDTVMRVPNSYIENKLTSGSWTDEPGG